MPRLSPAQRDHVAWLRALGVTVERFRRGRGSHLVAYLLLPDGRRMVAVLQLAEGDWRAPRNFRAAILRELRCKNVLRRGDAPSAFSGEGDALPDVRAPSPAA